MRTALMIVSCLMVVGLQLPVDALAQTCHGGPALTSERPVQINGGVGFSEGVTAIGGGVTAGNSAFFAAVGASRNVYDNLDDVTSTGFEVGGGAQVPTDSAGKVVICPEASFLWENGPNNLGGSGADVSLTGGGGGVSVGVVAKETSRVQIIPSAGFSIGRFKLKIDAPTMAFSESDTIGFLSGGVGFVFSRRFGISPFFNVPFGRDDSDPSFGISLSVAFGG